MISSYGYFDPVMLPFDLETDLFRPLDELIIVTPTTHYKPNLIRLHVRVQYKTMH